MRSSETPITAIMMTALKNYREFRAQDHSFQTHTVPTNWQPALDTHIEPERLVNRIGGKALTVSDKTDDKSIKAPAAVDGPNFVRRVVVFTLTFDKGLISSLYNHLFSRLEGLEKPIQVEFARHELAAKKALGSRPLYIFLADEAIVQEPFKEIRDGIIDYMQNGGMVLAMGYFVTMLSWPDVRQFFSQVGLSWVMATHCKENVTLNRTAVGDDDEADRLYQCFDHRARFVMNVRPDDNWYGPTRKFKDANGVEFYDDEQDFVRSSFAVGRVGRGTFVYVGDCSMREEADEVILAIMSADFSPSLTTSSVARSTAFK
jgi:hypothetical protein